MDQPPTSLRIVGPWLRWLVWAAALTVVTVALLTSEPAQVADEVLPEPTIFPLSKAVHITAYAMLAILTAWLPTSRRWRWQLLALLALHGFATELLQTWVPRRTGSVRDACFDLLGLAVGLVLTWRWWTRD